MAAKKKSSKSKPTPKKTAKRAPTPKKTASKPKTKSPVRRPPTAKPKDERARRLALFSQQVVKEEATPVAVRTFNEARAGIEQSKHLDIRSGQVTPKPSGAGAKAKPAPPPVPPSAVVRPPERSAGPPPQPQPEADEDLQAEIERDLEGMETENPPPRPKMEPLTGRLAVPKRSNPLEEEFRPGPSAKKGKKGAPPTKEEFGKIELRMQRGTKDEAIATASPDYLQRSFRHAAQKGKVAATAPVVSDEPHKPEEFEVAMDKGKRRVDAALTDFGDVEIAQQTRRGSRKVGKLDADEEDQGAA